MQSEEDFLRLIQQSPEDDLLLSVYADWLEEQGDSRAEYLRLVHTVQTAPKRLQELSRSIDPQWIARAVRRGREGRLIVRRDPAAEAAFGVNIVSASAIVSTKKGKSEVRIVGEYGSTHQREIGYLCAIVYDEYGDPLATGSGYARVASRGSFDFTISIDSPVSQLHSVALYPKST